MREPIPKYVTINAISHPISNSHGILDDVLDAIGIILAAVLKIIATAFRGCPSYTGQKEIPG